MTDIDHFREAEKLFEQAAHTHDAGEMSVLLARAQVHATLALAASSTVSGGNPPWSGAGAAGMPPGMPNRSSAALERLRRDTEDHERRVAEQDRRAGLDAH